MCGLAGVWGTGGDPAELRAVVGEMAITLRHRGPDDAGSWADPAAGIAFAHRRLSIVDLSPAGHQPMVSHCERYVLVLNGEIYNHRALRAELDAGEGAPHWRGHSDTEVFLAAVTRWGVRSALERANGMFALAVWDRSERRLSLARDRIGEKPLYVGRLGGGVAFASELKALRAHPRFTASIDRGALTAFLRFAYVPAPLSIYAGIAKLLPGHLLEITDPGATLPASTAYWDAAAVAEAGRERLVHDDDEALEELDTLLRDAVDLRRVADVPLGAFLSGGVDSSLVVALMQALSSRPVRTFSIGFHEAPYDEAPHAAKVARHLGCDHTELYVTPDEARAVIPALPRMYDEPFADASQIPTHLVAALARREVTVSLSGDGGDELFGGYNRHVYGPRVWRTFGPLPAPARRFGRRAIQALPPRTWDALLRPFTHLFPGALKHGRSGARLHKLATVIDADSPEALYVRLASHWRRPADLVEGGYEPPTRLDDRAGWPPLRDFADRMMFLDLLTYLPDDILVKVDRASMAVSLEARVPFLDPRVVELAWRLPLSMKIRDGRGKWILRQLLYRYVPRALVDRQKMGFSIPIDAWLRGPLRDWAEALLSETALRDAGLRPGAIRARWSEHLRGESDWQHYLWDVLAFQSWREVYG